MNNNFLDLSVVYKYNVTKVRKREHEIKNILFVIIIFDFI